jgi:hypothetical protein
MLYMALFEACQRIKAFPDHFRGAPELFGMLCCDGYSSAGFSG